MNRIVGALMIGCLCLLGGWLTWGIVTSPAERSTSSSFAQFAAIPDASAAPAPYIAPAPDAAATPATAEAPPPAATAPAVPLPAIPALASTPGGTTTDNASLVDAAWASRVAAATGIPYRALVGYAGASLRLATDQPGCHLGWSTLAAIGNTESGHGTHASSAIGSDGVDLPAVYGPSLDGVDFQAIPSGSGGGWARAAGPLQFIPSTWERWGSDGNGDGVADPQQIDDAALAAGRYLCNYGDLSEATGWRASVFAYNHVESYVDLVARTANEYAGAANG